ncbi:hypothetical protein BDU57DRAFT_451116 [Ampelomyces quisqualis]|uniref:Uncharacterized protein n=1 Tax=Ampelomyces quisqualis TaxID=50730 RepID=A0A6A5QKI4_AMPQU|nr:hypothetical protein BDU57DRAFT_451116 [Ampelomyces quisqualis]
MVTAIGVPPSGTRPYNAVLLTTFMMISMAGAWFMRISLILEDAPVGFNDMIKSGVHPNGVPVKEDFTGLFYLDKGLSFLVAAFLSGPAGWNEVYYWQQFHFLPQLIAIIAMMTVESYRERNQGSWLKYHSLFAFAYQNIGGAIVLPIWMLLLHRLSGCNTYYQSGRTIPLPYARLILPSMILLYLLPTIAIFIPSQSITMLQSVLAFWQLTPVFVNIPLWFASPFVSAAPATGKAKTADVKHLKALYNTILGISIIAHSITVYKIASSENPDVTFARVFLPSTAHWLTSMDNGLLWIFQWDWLLIGLCSAIPALVAIYDIQRLVPDIDDDPAGDKIFKGMYVTVALVVLGGPAAALVGVWGWREDQLAVLEERAEKEKGKKRL